MFIWLNFHVLRIKSFFFIVVCIKNDYFYLHTSLWSKYVSTFVQRFPFVRRCCSTILQVFQILPWCISFIVYPRVTLGCAFSWIFLRSHCCLLNDASCWLWNYFSCFDYLEQHHHYCSMTDFAKTGGNHLMRQCRR